MTRPWLPLFLAVTAALTPSLARADDPQDDLLRQMCREAWRDERPQLEEETRASLEDQIARRPHDAASALMAKDVVYQRIAMGTLAGEIVSSPELQDLLTRIRDQFLRVQQSDTPASRGILRLLRERMRQRLGLDWEQTSQGPCPSAPEATPFQAPPQWLRPG
ncbi:MAG TPA: hypothetical protein VL588_04695, partial [Bdellovibrionota bacterium]|nr:hypothetical protein [Bdellovibrionota bacterium]